MFDFGNANEGQRKAISSAEGPVLITAGPGTGKTYTLVQRAIYLIQECGVGRVAGRIGREREHFSVP